VRRRLTHRFALLLAFLAARSVAGTSPIQTAVQGLSPADAAEYPGYDSTAAGLVSRGLQAKALARHLVESPDDPDLPALLASRQRIPEALEALRRLVEQHPEHIVRAFGKLETFYFTQDQAQPHAAALGDVVALAKTRLSTLDRENAAAAARALLPIEGSLARGGSQGWAALVKSFVAEYSGTTAALLTEVDVISAGPLTAARPAGLEDFAAGHAGTCAAAKALYRKGFDLAHNAGVLKVIPMSGGDPAALFQQVVDLVKRLRGGGFPAPCEWVDKAPELISGFQTFRPKFSSPENIDAMLAVYREFVLEQFALDEANAAGSTMAFVLQTRMGDLFELKGDRVGGIEGVLSELEKRAKVPAAARFLRAKYYLSHLGSDRETAAVPKAAASLQGLAKEGVEPFSRRALAALASMHYYLRDYPAARAVYQQYLERYPASPWAWVAALRIGQTDVETNDLDAAAAAFARALTSAGALPPARLLAYAYRADALAGLGRVGDALKDAELALSEWDDDFGNQYSLRANQARRPGDDLYLPADTTLVTKEALTRRIAELRQSAEVAGGAALERGRWLIARGRPDEANAVLTRAAAEARGTALAAAALGVAHRASLEQALRLAGVENPKRDETAALGVLERLSSEPIDFPVVAAMMARATIRSRQGAVDADSLMTAALQRWTSEQSIDATPLVKDSLLADLTAIRNEIFRPLGGGVYGSAKWNAFNWPSDLPPFLVVNPDVTVKLSTGETRRVSVRRAIPGLNKVLFVETDHLALLTAMMRALGGSGRGQPAQVMATPNQPIGPSQDVRAFWNRYFPMRPGHWSGWEFETYPTITDVTFYNAERTRAAVRVTVGYSGGTVVLIKENGAWRATELVNLWIT
jgi:tetratricopeptide (TPR) repeat protein